LHIFYADRILGVIPDSLFSSSGMVLTEIEMIFVLGYFLEAVLILLLDGLQFR
jgi:hypothetical protein